MGTETGNKNDSEIMFNLFHKVISRFKVPKGSVTVFVYNQAIYENVEKQVALSFWVTLMAQKIQTKLFDAIQAGYKHKLVPAYRGLVFQMSGYNTGLYDWIQKIL